MYRDIGGKIKHAAYIMFAIQAVLYLSLIHIWNWAERERLRRRAK